MGAGGFGDALLDLQDYILALSGEELDSGFSGLVGAQQAILLIAAASVYRSGENIVQTAYQLSTGSTQTALGTGTE